MTPAAPLSTMPLRGPLRGPLFVNLPLAHMPAHPEYLPAVADAGLAPELGVDAAAMEGLDAAWHVQTAHRVAEACGRAAVHLPFFDLRFGSLDPLILQASRRRLGLALDLARRYAEVLPVSHMVGHGMYNAGQHAADYQGWLERSAATWLEVLGHWPDHPPLYLENTHEKDPEPVRDLVLLLRERLGGGPERVGVCFDVGHWFSFARGAVRRDLDRWLDCYAPVLRHLHLHDNCGADDEHLGLGAGDIPLRALFDGLAARGLAATATLEPHTPEAFSRSLAFLREQSQNLMG